jgi:hypothetical protein
MSAFKSYIPFFTLLAAAAICHAAGKAATHSLVAWDGEQAAIGSGWTHVDAQGEVSLRPQSAVAHSGNTALELRCKGTDWLGAGWNWVAFVKGTGTDVRSMKRLILWVKCSGPGGVLQINLLCGGQEFDTPEHHTEKVHLLSYCPTLLDGAWHRVAIPLADLRTVAGYDPTKVAELQMGLLATQPVDCSFLIDDIGFDDGAAKGIFPGRVVWVYNPNAAKWTGTGNYWDAAVNPQAEYDKSFTAGIAALSGGKGDADSWDKLFRWFNEAHGRAGTGYRAGDMIAIKINQNNSAEPGADHGNAMNANPQTCVAIVASLVKAGVPQADIWIGDPSRAVTDNIFQAIHRAFPEVKVVDHFGNDGRVTTTTVDGAFPNHDVKNAESACFYHARYLINQPLLKGHEGQVITFGAKNFYGICGILPDWRMNKRHPGDSTLTAFLTNPNFGGKVILWAMDAMYPSPALDGAPFNGAALTHFDGKPMSSFILSLDGCAEECVSYDFWSAISGQSGGIDYADRAAAAGAGIAGHWNNPTAKQYAKNLDPNADGIELVAIRVAERTAASTTPAVKPYLGVPFHDSAYQGGPQLIPGKLQNEYYDTMDIPDDQKAAGAEEGITYHDSDNRNSGSGTFNGKGTYLKEFRMAESPDISYTKFNNPETPIDDSPYNLVKPEPDSLYLGWIAPGEWVNYTVKVGAEGFYSLNILYTSKFGGHISFDSDGVDVSGPLAIPSTFNAADPVEWRQAHHWNKIFHIGKLYLKKGLQVLTLHFIDQPVMNFDYMEFVPAGASADARP